MRDFEDFCSKLLLIASNVEFSCSFTSRDYLKPFCCHYPPPALRLDITVYMNFYLDKSQNIFTAEKTRELAFLSADIFAIFGVLPLSRLRAYTLQDATFYTCSYLYTGNFTISTVKSRYSQCFNCLKLFYEERQYPKNGKF